MVTIYAQASDTFITSQTSQNDQAMLFYVTVVGTALSINYRTKQNKGLIKTTLISSV